MKSTIRPSCGKGRSPSPVAPRQIFPAIPARPGISKSQISAQSGFGLADFLLDYPNSENKRNVLLTERPGGIGSVFLQDSWKATSRLTLNYGIRYDRSVIPAYGTQASVGLQGGSKPVTSTSPPANILSSSCPRCAASGATRLAFPALPCLRT